MMEEQRHEIYEGSLKLRLMAVFMAVVLLPVAIHAQKFTAKNAEGVKIKYEVISASEKTVRVISADEVKQLVIPETATYQGTEYTVTAIGTKIFGNWNFKMESLELPSTLRVIEEQAFAMCTRLRKVTMPEGVREIQKAAFNCCNSLESLIIPEGVEKIGEAAFLTHEVMNKTDISSIKNFPPDVFNVISIPNSVKEIGRNAFGKTTVINTTVTMHEKQWTFYNLPPIITAATCKQYGISSSSVYDYAQSHPTPTPTIHVGNLTTTPTPTPKPTKPSSDVDRNLPSTTVNNDKTFAVIIANENYQEEVDVEYALNDGEVFKEYCHKVLGMPEDNVHIRKDATLNNMKAELSWMQDVAKAYNGQVRFIFYYAGHGMPNDSVAYLLPVDGKGTMPETGYKLSEFYKALGSIPAERVTVFIDACFSGSLRGNGMLVSARGIAIKVKDLTLPQSKMVVFSAAQGNETAFPLKDKGHGLFTYFLLKKLKETKGNVTYGELSSYITDQVSRKSIVANGKSQTPTITPSQAISGSWKTMKLK